jgi:hypothetical protein
MLPTRRIQDGFFPYTLFWAPQTKGGYLWVGGLSGALRFDGVRFTSWSAPLASTPILLCKYATKIRSGIARLQPTDYTQKNRLSASTFLARRRWVARVAVEAALPSNERRAAVLAKDYIQMSYGF